VKNTLDHGSVCKLITSCYSAQKVCSRCTLSVCLSVCLFAFAISQAWFPFKHTQRKYRNARITRKGTFLRAAIRARNVRTIVHHRAETLRAEKIGALSDPACVASVASVACDACVALRVFEWKPSFTLHLSPVSTTQVDGPSERPELTGDRFPLTVNTGRVDGRAFPLAELTSRQLG